MKTSENTWKPEIRLTWKKPFLGVIKHSPASRCDVEDLFGVGNLLGITSASAASLYLSLYSSIVMTFRTCNEEGYSSTNP